MTTQSTFNLLQLLTATVQIVIKLAVFPLQRAPSLAISWSHDIYQLNCLPPIETGTSRKLTSNGKQYTVTREMLTAVTRDQSVQLKVVA